MEESRIMIEMTGSDTHVDARMNGPRDILEAGVRSMYALDDLCRRREEDNGVNKELLTSLRISNLRVWELSARKLRKYLEKTIRKEAARAGKRAGEDIAAAMMVMEVREE